MLLQISIQLIYVYIVAFGNYYGWQVRVGNSKPQPPGFSLGYPEANLEEFLSAFVCEVAVDPVVGVQGEVAGPAPKELLGSGEHFEFGALDVNFAEVGRASLRDSLLESNHLDGSDVGEVVALDISQKDGKDCGIAFEGNHPAVRSDEVGEEISGDAAVRAESKTVSLAAACTKGNSLR